MNVPDQHIVANGDSSLFICWGDDISEETLKRVVACHTMIQQLMGQGWMLGVTECVPAYTTVMVNFDVSLTDFFVLKEQLVPLIHDLSVVDTPDLPVVNIPVCYHQSLGLDLQALADYCQLSIRDVIHLHSSQEYLVYMLGFMPGFLYLGGLNPRLNMPRKATPRQAIPAGSVGIAGGQTGIYPFASPGGWQVIGQTPIVMFDKEASSPAVARPFQKVQFVAIELDEYTQLKKDNVSASS